MPLFITSGWPGLRRYRFYGFLYLITAALLAAALFPACRPAGPDAYVAIVSPHLQYNSSEFRTACTAYEKDIRVDLYGVSEGQLPVFSVKELSRHSLVLLEGMGARISLLQPQIDSLKAVTKVLFLDSSIVQGNITLKQYPELGVYWANGNTENYKGMLSYLAANFFNKPVNVLPAIRYPEYGFYYPGRDSLFHTVAGYLHWYDSIHGRPADTTHIGLVFYQTNYVKKDMRHIDALIKSVEQHGATPVTFLGKGAFQLDSVFMVGNKPVVDVILYGGMFLNFSKPEKGRASAERLDVPLLGAVNHYLKSPAQWESDPGGFAPDMSDRAFFTERDGAFEPINIAGAATGPNGEQYTEPIDYQVNWRVERALAWAKLRHTPDKEKKIICTYYSEGSGKANVGADIDAYLDVPASLNRLLQAWKNQGYDVGGAPVPDARSLARLMSSHASNVGSWAPAELRRRAAAGEVVVIPEEEYLSWFHDYPAAQQQQVIDNWGPAPGRLMTLTDSNGKRSIVIPVLRFGNITLAPHPNWGLQDNPALIYGKHALPPTHAYIAFYEWMKRVYKPHAWLSLFTQLSLMPGKEEGPSAKDFVGELVGNIPHISLTPLIANGGVSNKRRASALTIGYITHITTAGLSDSMQLLNRKIDDWKTATNPAIKLRTEHTILTLSRSLHLDTALPEAHDGATNGNAADGETYIARLQAYLQKLARQRMPLGGHILGEAPRGETLITMVAGMLGKEFTTLLPGDRQQKELTAMKLLRSALLSDRPAAELAGVLRGISSDSAILRQLVLAKVYRDRLLQTPNEITQVLRALDGRYILPGAAGDPVNDPTVLPGGRDTYSGNDKNMPSKEAWDMGREMAHQLLQQYERKHGRGAYPKKVAFVLWSSEITHTQGVMEAEILCLVGARPVWNSKGQVMDVTLIPSAELGRPRIDVLITTSGTYRDHFGDKIRMLDKGIRLAADAPDSSATFPDHSTPPDHSANTSPASFPNWLARHARAYALQLHTDTGVALRIFSSDLGAFSTNLEFAAEDGESWKKDTALSNLYLNRMAFAYGQNVSASYRRQLFELNIKDIDAAAFSRSSSVYGLMDHPMVAAYFGAYNLAVRNTTGRTPDLFINDLQDPAAAEVTPIADMYRLELQGRYLNPKWIKGMMDHGYDGARYMEAFTEDLFLWNITSPDMVKTEDWDQVYETYLQDRDHLGLADYFGKQNPYALQSMASVMLESAEKGYWKASDQQLTAMAKTLTASVVQNGPTCNTAVCNSPGLSAYVVSIMDRVPGAQAQTHAYQARLLQLKTAGSGPGSPASARAGSSGAPGPGSAVPTGTAPGSAVRGDAPASAAAVRRASSATSVTGKEITAQNSAVSPSYPPVSPVSRVSPLSGPSSLWLLIAGAGMLVVLFAAGWIRRER
jgi:cobaltochelatase CobN